MKRIVILILLVISASASINAQQASEDQVLQLFEIQNVENNLELLADSLIKKLSAMTSPIPEDVFPDFWNRLKGKILKDSCAEFKNALLPIYQRNFTADEMSALIDFSSSPMGLSILEKISNVQLEVMQAGELVGQQASMSVLEDIEAEKLAIMSMTYTGCSELSVGRFVSFLPTGDTVFIQREDNIQFTYMGETTSKYLMHWIDECKVELKLVETDNDLMAPFLYKTFTANIYEVGDKYYNQLMAVEDEDLKVYNTINIAEK